MAKWKYQGTDKDGKRTQGDIEASSEKEAKKLLRAKGIRPRKIIPPTLLEMDLGEWLVMKGIGSQFGQAELANFTKQFSIMLSAGVPILQALEILFMQERNPSLKKSLKSIGIAVSEGKTLADAMAEQRGFDRLYVNLIRAGEAGGILDTILKKLTIHMEKAQRTKKQIKSAMMYPAVVVVVGIVVIIGMMMFVVPQFVSMLADTGQEPPLPTKMVMEASAFIQSYAMVLIPGLIVGAVFLKSWIRTPTGKPVFDRVMMKVPIFGDVIIKGNLNTFTRTLGTMLSSGVPMVDSLDICIQTIDNGIIATDLAKVKKDVVNGKTLTEPITKIKYFPPMVAQMIRVGEQTGNIDSMLDKISDVFEEDLNDLTANMSKMIEPIVLVGLGGIVGFILIAMYLPIFMQAGGQ